MVDLADLWLPILLSAVAVFIVSSVIHMVIPIHKKDYVKLPGESTVLDALRKAQVGPGSYIFPCASSMKDMGSPEMLERYRQGPVGFLTMVPNGPVVMGKHLLQWFVLSIAISVVVAYVASIGIQRGDPGGDVFRLSATVAFAAYGLSNVTDSIWKGVRWGITVKFLFDGLLYGLATAACFSWLWPAAAA